MIGKTFGNLFSCSGHFKSYFIFIISIFSGAGTLGHVCMLVYPLIIHFNVMTGQVGTVNGVLLEINLHGPIAINYLNLEATGKQINEYILINAN